ncbi:hypothetical protein GWI33_014734 [Rhynchophorus ferrugineus]|uniref:Uncharacterized protein n=1 Tax=Rhynchophorus ferrugineus TaxID=354439 RepID=A0A834MAD6_RHYFE|nr:hypothetical protein GWI33_014734 [Rhynchophorus ferrugineus]
MSIEDDERNGRPKEIYSDRVKGGRGRARYTFMRSPLSRKATHALNGFRSGVLDAIRAGKQDRSLARSLWPLTVKIFEGDIGSPTKKNPGKLKVIFLNKFGI